MTINLKIPMLIKIGLSPLQSCSYHLKSLRSRDFEDVDFCNFFFGGDLHGLAMVFS